MSTRLAVRIDRQMRAFERTVIREDQEWAARAFTLIERQPRRELQIAQQNYAAKRYRICRQLMGLEA